MEQLIRGIRQFQSQVYQREHDFFAQLVQGQSPSTLFVTCSDSRVDPTLITQSGPGELFVLRNAGNIVPAFGASNGGEGATIEYAVSALGVRDIVVCGHTRCGAIQALFNPPTTSSLKLVTQWLAHAETTRRIIEENYPDVSGADRVDLAVQEHVLVQIENLQTHPSVAAKLQRGELTLHGWVYELEHGCVRGFCTEQQAFIDLNPREPAPRPTQPRGSVRTKRAKTA